MCHKCFGFAAISYLNHLNCLGYLPLFVISTNNHCHCSLQFVFIMDNAITENFVNQYEELVIRLFHYTILELVDDEEICGMLRQILNVGLFLIRRNMSPGMRCNTLFGLLVVCVVGRYIVLASQL